MKAVLERTILTVMRDGAAWAVDQDGGLFGQSPDKEVARASAHKRAREIMDAGGAVQVLVQGELPPR